MKQAVIILAHKNITHLKKILDFFDRDFYFYIHIDKKSQISEDDISILQNNKNVVCVSKHFKVNWAGLNVLKSLLFMSKEVLKNKDIEYVHAISGNDFPIKTNKYFKNLLINNKGKEYIEYFELPVKERDWGKDGGMDRIWYYNLYDVFNAKTFSGKIAIRSLLKIQKLLKIKRNLPREIPKLFGGEMWWTLSYPCLKYVIDRTEQHPYFIERLKYSSCAEEIYFQTIIMNSPFKANVVNNHLRYIEWNQRNGNKPANLDETDYEKLINSDAIFARKFEYPVSEKLIDCIENNLIS